MKTLTIAQLKQERPEVRTLPSGVTTWMAWIVGDGRIHRGIGELSALQSLCRAMHWDVEVVEDRKEQCKLCQQWVTDWVDPDWAGGRICRPCEGKHDPEKSYCTRCGKLPDGCVCQDGPRALMEIAQQSAAEAMEQVGQILAPLFEEPEPQPTPTPRTDALAFDLEIELGNEMPTEVQHKEGSYVHAKDARTLERELTAALETIKELRK